jgi:NitT/TauT family transport system substrate-binding protein
MVAQPDQAIAILGEKYYPGIPSVELKEEFGAQKVFSSREWRRMYLDGTVTNWLQRVTDFYVSFAAIQRPAFSIRFERPRSSCRRKRSLCRHYAA